MRPVGASARNVMQIPGPGIQGFRGLGVSGLGFRDSEALKPKPQTPKPSKVDRV